MAGRQLCGLLHFLEELCLAAEEIVAHGVSQTVEAVVRAFADLSCVVVPDEAPGEAGLEDVVTEGVLHDLPLEVNGEDEALLGLVHLEGVVGAEGIVPPLKPIREVSGALDGLHAVAHGGRVVALSAACFLVRFVKGDEAVDLVLHVKNLCRG